jgi:hypothetical protein
MQHQDGVLLLLRIGDPYPRPSNKGADGGEGPQSGRGKRKLTAFNDNGWG